MLHLLFDLAIIIAAARGMGALARRVGQPAVVGEILAGILLGPSVLGRLAPGVPALLFPPEVPLRQFADLGLVLFMFLVGLELDPRLIRQEGRRALTISLGGVLLPFGLGILLAGPLAAVNAGGRFLGEGTDAPPLLAFALFMGAAMCITAFPVLARILIERGLYRTPLGTAALCAAAIDDVIAWILLAAVVAVTRTGSPAEAGRALLLTALFVALMVTVGRRLLAGLTRRYEARGHVSVDLVATVIIGLLLAAWATEWIGVHSIFGAFIFGAIMPRGSGMTQELTDRIEDFTVVVLLPIFFTVAGLRTDVFTLGEAPLLGWLVVIVGAAVVGKLAGAGLAARLSGFSGRDALALGTLMNARGLTELVILNVGIGLGVLSDRTYAMMVIMALATTFMTAPLIRALLPRRERIRVLSGGDPPPTRRRVLVALGNPDNAAALVDAGVLLAGTERPAELLLIRLVPTPRAPEFRTGLRDEESNVDRAMRAIEQQARRAAAAGLTARAVSFLSNDVAGDLAIVAEAQRCDLVVVGWHRASLPPAALRRMVRRLFALAPCQVAVLVDAAGAGLRTSPSGAVVVARTADGEEPAVDAAARHLAAALGVRPRFVLGPTAVRDEAAAAPRRSRLSQRLSQALRLSGSTEPPAPYDGGPEYADVLRESASASALVVSTGVLTDDGPPFGEPASALAEGVAVPTLVIHPRPDRRRG